jgi:hypothetical protein|tara:strand:- start:1498 stop:2097 length:600 start_codon:yes stop_codon:yes gene_type:complete
VISKLIPDQVRNYGTSLLLSKIFIRFGTAKAIRENYHRHSTPIGKIIILIRNIYSSLLIVVLSLAGCGMAEYDDISSDVKYAHLIGGQYQTLQRLRLHAVTLDRNSRKKIDIYNLTEYPGFGGPEVIYSRQLKPASLFQIKTIIKCNNCIFDSRIKIVVDILSEDLDSEMPVHLPNMQVEDVAKRIILDPKFFRKIITE